MDAGYRIIEAENTLPLFIEGLRLNEEGEAFKYPAPPILNLTGEENIFMPGKLVSEKRKVEQSRKLRKRRQIL